jgi:type I restriction enzyme M protein
MTSTQQRAAHQRQIWQIANDVRGAVDGWDFKQYVLGSLFYRFISENFASYIEAEDTREVIAITQLNAELKTNVIKIDQLRVDIDSIVAATEGTEVEA